MKTNKVISLILKAVGFGMPVVVLVLSIMKISSNDASIVMLSIGLLALALDSFQAK